ncbi:MAG: sodium:calcium antiporter [Candidatus Anstonellales archaeon]
MAVEELFLLIGSTIFLAKSSELVVENAARLAKFFGISQLTIGMILIAVSTSLPELSVSVLSSVIHEGSIAAGNVFGSNIANILLVLGLGAFLYSFRIDKDSLPSLTYSLLLTTTISAYILIHSYFTDSALGFYEGIFLLLIGLWFLHNLLKDKRMKPIPTKRVHMYEGIKSFFLFLIGIIAVIISSGFVVDSAVNLSNILGLAKSFIGSTIIAVGTSLPELSIDLQSIKRRQYKLAIGDALGSNVVNLTLVLGSAAAISPISVNLKIFSVALLFAIIANIVFYYFVHERYKLAKTEGISLLIVYLFYIIIISSIQLKEAEIFIKLN